MNINKLKQNNSYILMIIMIISIISFLGQLVFDNFYQISSIFMWHEDFRYRIYHSCVFLMIIMQSLFIFYFYRVQQFNIKLFLNVSILALIITELIFLIDITTIIAYDSKNQALFDQMSNLAYKYGFLYVRYMFYQLPFIILIFGFFIKTHCNFINKIFCMIFFISSSLPFLFAISLYVDLSYSIDFNRIENLFQLLRQSETIINYLFFVTIFIFSFELYRKLPYKEGATNDT
ncbi:hypothetical protein CRV08_06650 [Halarcobacter ebronensis]|uniref:Uncharacterized protein n=1 Tax=Halarcobacter ebronensis TaxID=1462615 RepID=A0A4Q0YEB9_9BACT|nr:hypothetical protein [Halarcobacter ebronensis]RXJ68503.1 hypothetical protein CRV08_06650 [Halarcobacter ebronensis]